jgi:hypothetical protein
MNPDFLERRINELVKDFSHIIESQPTFEMKGRGKRLLAVIPLKRHHSRTNCIRN